MQDTKKQYSNSIKTKIKIEGVPTPEMWANVETGEVREFLSVEKTVRKDVNFWKVFLPYLLDVLDYSVGGKRIKVVKYILENISPYDNSFNATLTEIKEGAGVGHNTANTTIKLLTESSFLVKIRQSNYRVNPKFIAKGSPDKRMNLMIKFDREKTSR